MKVFLIGFMGAGKSYWGKKWAESSGLDFYDLDSCIEQDEQLTVSELFRTKGEKQFRKAERKKLNEFFEKDNYILACGGGTPCFYDNMKRMNKRGITVWLKTDIDTLAKRLNEEKEARPLVIGLEGERLEEFIRLKLAERIPWYRQSLFHFNTEYLTEDNFRKIIKRYE